mmetsp:Transcript_96279/g.171019  ORF Transcript_96279/g.171019 Transcript_96279/m.171019 type:complete len:199 (+) Transcript_96279:84-680(+)
MGAACCSDIDKAQNNLLPAQPAAYSAVPASLPLPGENGGFGVPQAFSPENQQEGGQENGGGDAMSQSQIPVSEMVDEVTAKEQRREAKQVVKEFVKEMVKGRKMNVMTQAGQLKTCVASLTRSLDAIKIKVGNQTRSIALRDIDEIAAGADLEGISTPLDELCATLMLTDDCITFRFVDLNARDTFVMCLLMFCNSQK